MGVLVNPKYTPEEWGKRCDRLTAFWHSLEKVCEDAGLKRVEAGQHVYYNLPFDYKHAVVSAEFTGRSRSQVYMLDFRIAGIKCIINAEGEHMSEAYKWTVPKQRRKNFLRRNCEIPDFACLGMISVNSHNFDRQLTWAEYTLPREVPEIAKFCRESLFKIKQKLIRDAARGYDCGE
jgi:hypothetical protein